MGWCRCYRCELPGRPPEACGFCAPRLLPTAAPCRVPYLVPCSLPPQRSLERSRAGSKKGVLCSRPQETGPCPCCCWELPTPALGLARDFLLLSLATLFPTVCV